MKKNAYKQFLENIKTYKYPTKKRAATAKQLEALAKGREYRQQQLINRYVAEAQSRYIKTREYTEDFIPEKYVNRLIYASKQQGISVSAAHKALMHTFPYTNVKDNYRYQIFEHVNWNELRRAVAEAQGSSYTVDTRGTVRVQGGLSREQIEAMFTDNNDTLVAGFPNGRAVYLSIVAGSGSDNPDFVKIETH